MENLIKEIVKSHTMKKAAEKEISEREPDGMIVTYHDHYDQPRFTVFPSGVPAEYVMFVLTEDGSLDLVDRKYYGNLDKSRSVLETVLGIK